ncbi:unnamed protein product [Somion occarium]|uniref:Uncharacterized protein n=1 Tax=Somion occarium TaxID=3059160 RepID=A0ABP1DJA0_9APHY
MIMPVFSHPLPMESSKDNFELVARSTLNKTAPRSLEYMANLDQAPEINIASQLTTKADPLLLRRYRNKRFDWRNFSPWSPFLGCGDSCPSSKSNEPHSHSSCTPSGTHSKKSRTKQNTPYPFVTEDPS